MKLRSNWLLVPAVALSLGACGEKEKPKAPETPTTAAAGATEKTPTPEVTPTPAPVPEVKKVTAPQRAAKLGFLKHLSQDTEIVMSFHEGAKAVNRVKAGKLWKLIESESGMVPPSPDGEKFELPDGDDAGALNQPAKLDTSKPMLITADAPAKEAAVVVPAKDGVVAEPPAAEDDAAAEISMATLFGKEFTLAFGQPVGDQSANLMTMYKRLNFYQMRMMARGFAAAAKSGDFSDMAMNMAEQQSAMYKDLLADPASGVTLLDKMQMPPIYAAFLTTAKDSTAAARQLASLTTNISMMGGEMIEQVSVEKAGGKFEGIKISGAKIAKTMENERTQMEESLDAATVDKLLAAVAKKDLVIASGVLGDYVVLFIGSSTDEIKFAESPEQSLCAGDRLAFADEYLDKDLAAVVYGNKDALVKMSAAAGGIADMAAGLREGLSGAEGLGDTRDLEALLRMVGERESALIKLVSHDTLGMTAFFEDGLKIESVGGTDAGAIDWKATNQLSALGDSEDVMMFANMTSEAAYDEQAREYLETLAETAYAMSRKVSEFPIKDGDIAQFASMSKVFDEKFRTDAVALWDALSKDFSGSIGKERALVIDLKGSMPTIPGVPQTVINEAKCPRIALVAPVTDRAKLAASWDKMNTVATHMLATVNTMTGKDFPMQKPMSSEKNGNTTWFFSFPFINDDFVPSVTVGDKWFAASTSKNQALDLIAKAEKGGAGRTGLVINMNFNSLRKFSKETVSLLEKNSQNLFNGGGPTADDFKKASKIIEALAEMDSLTIHARREGGAMRTSLHLKTH